MRDVRDATDGALRLGPDGVIGEVLAGGGGSIKNTTLDPEVTVVAGQVLVSLPRLLRAAISALGTRLERLASVVRGLSIEAAREWYVVCMGFRLFFKLYSSINPVHIDFFFFLSGSR